LAAALKEVAMSMSTVIADLKVAAAVSMAAVSTAAAEGVNLNPL
jgi:hypothetical protein